MHDVSCSANGDDKGISAQINREIRAYGCNEWRDPALEKLQAPEGAVKWARQEAKRQDMVTTGQTHREVRTQSHGSATSGKPGRRRPDQHRSRLFVRFAAVSDERHFCVGRDDAHTRPPR